MSDNSGPRRSYVSASVCHVGLRRSVNEDAVYVGSAIFAVADGLGGHRGGDVASRLAVAGLATLDQETQLSPGLISICVRQVNDEIHEFARAHPEIAGLGTTISGIAVVTIDGADHIAIFNVGDSRVYRLTDNRLARATVDHSEIEELILRGEMSEVDGRFAVNRHIITRSLGTTPAPRWISGSCRCFARNDSWCAPTA